MPDVAAIRAQIEAQGWLKGGRPAGDYKFKKCEPRDFDDGTYPVRPFPSHSEHAPQGFRIVRYHKFRTRADANAEIQWALCSASYEPWRVDYACQLVNPIKKAGWDQRMPTVDREVFGLLMGENRMFMPAIVQVEEYTQTSRKGNPFTRYRPVADPAKATVLPIVWTITAGGLAQKLLALYEEYPDLNDAETGRMLRFTKKRYDYEVIPAKDPRPLGDAERELMSDYPHIASFGKKNQLNDAQMADLCQNSFWADGWRKMGINLDLAPVEVPSDTPKVSTFGA